MGIAGRCWIHLKIEENKKNSIEYDKKELNTVHTTAHKAFELIEIFNPNFDKKFNINISKNIPIHKIKNIIFDVD